MPQDLISLTRAKLAFPNLSDTSQDATISTLITAASRATERFCKRTFAATSYDRVLDLDGTGTIILPDFPILSVSRVALSPVTVLTIQNTLNPQTQAARCTVATTLPNAADWPAASNGLVLTRVDASGNTNTDATLLWATYPTVTQVATAVNAVGTGWKATVGGNYGIWPSADINAVQGALSAFGSGAQLTIHTTDQTQYDLVPETGELRFSGSLNALDFSAGWVGSNYTVDILPGVAIPRGSRNLRIAYTAGFYQIPDDIQEAVALWTAHMFSYPTSAGSLQSETLGDYSYSRELHTRPPHHVETLLWPYRNIYV